MLKSCSSFKIGTNTGDYYFLINFCQSTYLKKGWDFIFVKLGRKSAYNKTKTFFYSSISIKFYASSENSFPNSGSSYRIFLNNIFILEPLNAF